MKRTRTFRMVAAGVVVALTSAVAVQTTTQTASANDYQILYDNLDDALGVLLTGVGDAVNEYLTGMSAVAAGHVLNAALVAAGQTLVAGTAQFGSLGLGLLLLQGAINGNLDPLLGVLDDPASAASLYSADDLAVIYENLVPALTAILTGDGFTPGVIQGIGEAIQGNLVDCCGLLQFINSGYLVGNAIGGILTGLLTLVGSSAFFPPVQLVGIAALVGGGALFSSPAGPYILSVQTTLQGLLQGQLGVVTAPVSALLTGFTIPALPIPLP